MEAPQFLRNIYPEGYESSVPDGSRPFVTLTYAQSIDGCIAGQAGKQILLSGKESMVMTHWMRTLHAGILVGSNTLRNDNPQLNTRHLPTRIEPYNQPRPIILDTHIKMPPDCKLVQNFQRGVGIQPWILAGHSDPADVSRIQRKAALEALGVKIIEVGTTASQQIDLTEALIALRTNGISSLMVEGGASVIASFLDLRDPNGQPVVDMHIVTVAPMIVGSEGVQAVSLISTTPVMHPVAAEVFGKDAVFASKLRGDKP
ncbi:bacterial bifunctional deaminase-reductase [Clavulina sp. PMI_390]|nr:bacterial bifunctional deaminase-reductase [Clavulina sp. PMI_390]